MGFNHTIFDEQDQNTMIEKLGLTASGASHTAEDSISGVWQRLLAQAIRDPEELCRRLQLDAIWVHQARAAAAQFPVLVPESFLARMKPGDPHDPLLRQVLPLSAENETVSGFTTDPVAEHPNIALATTNESPLTTTLSERSLSAKGMIRKYPGRVLLILSGACAVHCRYCFRRHFPYNDRPVSLSAWQPTLDQIAADPTIEEVILSGGDPLTRTDSWLAAFVRQLEPIPHVLRLRLHTRLPIVLPERINDTLLQWLGQTRLTPIVVVHCNHPQELTGSVPTALLRLVEAGILVLNQAVLLRGVNDNLATLIELSRALLQCRVLPYYLHQLDRVSGAAHFEVPEAVGQELMRQLQAQLPGYAVPRYVREVPGESSKVPILF